MEPHSDHSGNWLNSHFPSLKKKKIIYVERETKRERENVGEGKGQRERETESIPSGLRAVSAEPDVGLKLMNRETVT